MGPRPRYELDEAHRRVVAAAHVLFDDAGVAAALALLDAVEITRRDLLEQLADEVDLFDAAVGERARVLQRQKRRDLALHVQPARDHSTTVGLLQLGDVDREVVAEPQRFGDQALGDAPQLLSLGIGRLDPPVQHQVRGQVAEHGAPVRRVAVELPE